VAYASGLDIDQPLSVTRFGYRSLMDQNGNERSPLDWATLALMPRWTSRGLADIGTFEDGGVDRCTTFQGVQRCIWVDWPAQVYAYARTSMRRNAWHGSVTEDKGDAAGTHYRRNRLYDPATGRFTQEDPIGLAGGVNLYGFATGDPVNFTDPFGVCPNVKERYNPKTGMNDVTFGLQLKFAAGTSAADQTAVRNAIVKHWAGVRGTLNVIIDFTDASAQYDVSIVQKPAGVPSEGVSNRYRGGRLGATMMLADPSGHATHMPSALIGHEFGHASGMGWHDYQSPNSIMYGSPPGSVTDVKHIGNIIRYCSDLAKP
jgi:RHS repeat-associated protein